MSERLTPCKDALRVTPACVFTQRFPGIPDPPLRGENIDIFTLLGVGAVVRWLLGAPGRRAQKTACWSSLYEVSHTL